MNPISKDVQLENIDVGGKDKEIINTSPLPAEILSCIFSMLPLSDRLSLAKTNHFNLFLFYASSVLKGDYTVTDLGREGMLEVIDFILSYPTDINDRYIPCTPTGREYLISKGIGGPLTARKIQNGLPIEYAIATRQAILAAFNKEFSSLGFYQLMHFKIGLSNSVEQRIANGKSLLVEDQRTKGRENGVFEGVLILEGLSQLDHPSAEEAKSILNTWLSNSKNRVYLITRCAAKVAASEFNKAKSGPFQISCGRRESEEILDKQIDILLQDIQTRTNKAAANVLVTQLIDLLIALEFLGENDKNLPHMNELCSTIYQRLLDSPAIDQTFKYDIRDHKMRSDNNKGIHQRLTSMPITNDRSHGIFFPYRCDKHYENHYIYNYSEARHIQESIHFLQKVIDQGCSLLADELERLKKIVNNTFERANKCVIEASSFWTTTPYTVNRAIELYEQAETAGHPEAKLQRLKFLSAEKKDTAVQFELGKMYLDSANALFLNGDNLQAQEMVLMAQKELESAASHGMVEAAVLVAQHYSTLTPHQPKFKSTQLFKNSDDKAMEFMDRAVRSGFENAKEMIYENELPTYLKKIVEQIDPTALEIIFNLSEKVENKLLGTEDDRKLSNVLLKAAVEKGNSNAVKKLNAQQTKLEQELKIKLALQMNAQEEQEKKKQPENQRAISLNFSLFGPDNVVNKIEDDNYKL